MRQQPIKGKNMKWSQKHNFNYSFWQLLLGSLTNWTCHLNKKDFQLLPTVNLNQWLKKNKLRETDENPRTNWLIYLVEVSQLSNFVPQVSHDLLVLFESSLIPVTLALKKSRIISIMTRLLLGTQRASL